MRYTVGQVFTYRHGTTWERLGDGAGGMRYCPGKPVADEDGYPGLVAAYICSACLDGEGDECHTPGCAFWMQAPPSRDFTVRLVPWFREAAFGLRDTSSCRAERTDASWCVRHRSLWPFGQDGCIVSVARGGQE